MNDEPFSAPPAGTTPDGEFELEEDVQIDEPRMYLIILHNDDYTTMDFVVEVLTTVFHKPAAEATRIMLDVHRKGWGNVGVYTYDITVSKIEQVHNLAKEREFPLRCTYKEA